MPLGENLRGEKRDRDRGKNEDNLKMISNPLKGAFKIVLDYDALLVKGV